MNLFRRSVLRSCAIAMVSGAILLCGAVAEASPAKFDIPGAFPGNFQIDFLGTDFKLFGQSSGSLSTTSTINFSVGAETSTGSGIYNISVSPDGFQFDNFSPAVNLGLEFDVYGAGAGNGTFDTNTGDWFLDIPTLFVHLQTYGASEFVGGQGTRVDLHLTTQNIWIYENYPGANNGYLTTSATPMNLDESSTDPWGDLNLVAGGVVPFAADLTLDYDLGLISTIASGYDWWDMDLDEFAGFQYEFDIFGNDPLVASSVPEPTSILLIASGLTGLAGLRRRM